MSYHPQRDSLDFELGAFGDRLKKVAKGAVKVVDKITDATITKPSMAIGGAIGGKKGRELGRKLGGFTSTVTKLGVGAGAAGALLPLASTAGLPIAAGLLASKAMGGKKGIAGRKGGMGISAGMRRLSGGGKLSASGSFGGFGSHKQSCKGNNALAAKVATVLVAKLGGPLGQANKALKLAALQREATYEHKALMSNAEFRKKVLSGINKMAANGDLNCQRTIRVLVGR
jgi:hypothetical protein